MYQFADFLGFGGAILVAIAYFPQITHLVKEHCAYGISIKAWALWFVATLMIMPKAAMSKNAVFIALLFVQIIATLFILIFSYFHRGKVCGVHRGIF